MCPTGQGMMKGHGFMSFELFKTIIEQSKGYLYNINLHHRGESLLHKDIEKFIIYAKKNGIYTNLHTNGSLLTEEKSKMILRSGLDLLSFSIDGFDSDTYRNIRGKGDFNKTITNIKTFLELKMANKSSKPYTIIEFLNINGFKKRWESEKKRFLEIFNGLPLDKFTIKEPHNFTGDIQVSEGCNKSIHKSKCLLLWYSMTILWDGRVLPCPQDFLARYIIGDLKKESLIDIWNGKKLQYLRKKMVANDLKDFSHCISCDRLYRKTFLGIPIEGVKRFFHENLLRDNLHEQQP